MTIDNPNTLYDSGFLSAYLDGRLAKDHPQRVGFEADLALNEALSQQLGHMAQTQASIQSLLTLMDASPRLPNVTQAVMQRFSSRYAGLASPTAGLLNQAVGAEATPAPKSTCASMTPALLCAWADGELLMADHNRVSQHLGDCAICQQTVHELQQTTLHIQQTLRQQPSTPSHTPNSPSQAVPASVWPLTPSPLGLPKGLATSPQVHQAQRLQAVPSPSPFASRYGAKGSQLPYGWSPFASALWWVLVLLALLGLISWLKAFIT
jgi:anti-sigma factor RsiW